MSNPSKKHSSFSWTRKDGTVSNGTHGVGRIVLSIVQDYVEDYKEKTGSDITIKDLQGWFPEDPGNNKSRGIRLGEYIDFSEKPKRFFIDEEERLKVHEGFAYVTSQWGDTEKFAEFKENIIECGYTIHDED